MPYGQPHWSTYSLSWVFAHENPIMFPRKNLCESRDRNRHTIKMKYRKAWVMILLQWCNAVLRELLRPCEGLHWQVVLQSNFHCLLCFKVSRGWPGKCSTAESHAGAEGGVLSLHRLKGWRSAITGYTDSWRLCITPLPISATVTVTGIRYFPSLVGCNQIIGGKTSVALSNWEATPPVPASARFVFIC